MQFTITLAIVIITCIISISAFSNQKIMDDLIFYPPMIKRNQWYRFITHGLIHADAGHLIFNMIALYSFCTALETSFGYPCLFGNNGKWVFLILYLGGLIAASIPDFIKHKDIEDGINEFAETHDLDLVIAIPKKHRLLDGLFKKSSTRQLVFESHVPVMCVHE